MPPARLITSRIATIVAVVFLTAAAVLALGDGLDVRVAGVHLTANDPWRPLASGVAALVLAVAAAGPRAALARVRRTGAGIVAAPHLAAIGLAIAVALVSLAFNSWTASGPDSFAYVSQAALWREGRLALSAPLAATAPWPDPVTTFAPYGYRAAPEGAPMLVPVTSPGLPMAMAALQALFGETAAFAVTPIAGAALVLLTFAIGRRAHSPLAGLVAAWLAATSPAALFMLMWPMTDLPAAAASALLVWCLLGRSTAGSLAAGLVAGAALLLRPNLVLVAAAAGGWLLATALFERAAWRRVALFVVGCLPGLVVFAWINTRWYGAPFASGYGSPSSLLSLGHAGVNLRLYVTWLLESSPLVAVGLVLIAWWTIRPGALPRGTAALFALIAGSVAGLYLLYEPFTVWWYLRFLLPLWPVACVAAAVGLIELARRSRGTVAAVVLVTVSSGAFGVWFARTHDVFLVGERERRYAAIAHLVDTMSDPHAVIITAEHAGTIRYYAGRETIRWDMLDAAWLDRAVAWLAATGRHPYVLIEDWEQPAFARKFGPDNRLGRLSYAAVFAWQSRRTPGWTWLYDPLRADAPTATPDPDLERQLPRIAPMSRRFTTPEGPVRK